MKKFLPIFLIIIIALTVAVQTTKAISFSEIFTSLSNKLYALRNLLTAQLPAHCANQQVLIPPGAQMTPGMTTCYADRDCTLINIPFASTGCMYCQSAGD